MGWAVLVGGMRPRVLDSGTWHPSKARGADDPFDQLADFIVALLEQLGPAEVIVEIPDGGERYRPGKGGKAVKLGGKSERTYCQAVGVCRAVPRALGLPIYAVGVNRWKGNSKKSYTALVVARCLGLDLAGRTDNETDALGLGLWWLQSRKLDLLRRQAVPSGREVRP